MKKILKSKISLTIFFFMLFINFSLESLGNENQNFSEEIFIGNKNAPVKIIVYSSLTCPHCANFHKNILPLIKKEFVDTNKAIIILRDFPLDLAALNASKILRCVETGFRLKFLDEIYSKQNKLVGDISVVNTNLIEMSSRYNADKDKVNECLKNPDLEEVILNTRINGHNKYKIESTPTVIINEKKLEGSLNFKNIEKRIKKII